MKLMYKYLWLIIAVAMISCDEDLPVDTSNNNTSEVKTEEVTDTLNRPTEAMKENIVSQLDSHFKALTEGDYAAYVEFVYPGSFPDEETKKQTIEQLSGYDEQGWHNITETFRVEYFSPLVEDSIGLISMLDVYVESSIVIDESFPQKPETFESMIKSKYGKDNVGYDPATRTYHVIGNNVMYAITPKDSIHFTFLSATFTQSPLLANLMPFNTVRQLKIYEKEKP